MRSPSLSQLQPHPASGTPLEIGTLSRYLSCRRPLKPNLSLFSTEAETALQVSISEACVRYAISSLSSIRENFDRQGQDVDHSLPPAPNLDSSRNTRYALQQYNAAIVTLSQKLSSATRESIYPTLICCQLFMSIELSQLNYSSAGLHFIRGLRIMQEYQVRPSVDEHGNFLPARNPNLPLVDAFAIKFFSTSVFYPKEQLAAMWAKTLLFEESSGYVVDEYERVSEILRRVHPQLVDIANKTLNLLDDIMILSCEDDIKPVLSRKACLLMRLREWYDNAQVEMKGGENPITIEGLIPKLMLYFYSAVKVILMLALGCAWKIKEEVDAELEMMSRLLNRASSDVPRDNEYWHD